MAIRAGLSKNRQVESPCQTLCHPPRTTSIFTRPDPIKICGLGQRAKINLAEKNADGIDPQNERGESGIESIDKSGVEIIDPIADPIIDQIGNKAGDKIAVQTRRQTCRKITPPRTMELAGAR